MKIRSPRNNSFSLSSFSTTRARRKKSRPPLQSPRDACSRCATRGARACARGSVNHPECATNYGKSDVNYWPNLRGSSAAGAIIAPGARARQLRASFDVPGGRLAPGRVGGAPTWPTCTLFRRDLGGGLIFGDIAPEWGNRGPRWRRGSTWGASSSGGRCRAGTGAIWAHNSQN